MACAHRTPLAHTPAPRGPRPRLPTPRARPCFSGRRRASSSPAQNVGYTITPPSCLGACGRSLLRRPAPQPAVILDDISAWFEAGEMTALMGPSGSGKTVRGAALGGTVGPGAGGLRAWGGERARSGA